MYRTGRQGQRLNPWRGGRGWRRLLLGDGRVPLRCATVTYIRDQLQRHDCTPATAARCVTLADVRRGSVVLEPGAGTGAITAALLDAGAVVHGVEVESARLAALRERFAAPIRAGHLVLHPGDATRLVPRMPPGWLVVGNPPFQITSALLRRWLLETGEGPAGMALILQREAAQRLCGTAEAMSRWSVLLHLAGKPRIAAGLLREATVPPSRVDLLIFAWRRRSQAPPAADLLLVDRLLEKAFAGPHTVTEALRGMATATILRRQGADNGWQPQAHPRTVPPAAWLALARFLAGIGRL